MATSLVDYLCYRLNTKPRRLEQTLKDAKMHAEATRLLRGIKLRTAYKGKNRDHGITFSHFSTGGAEDMMAYQGHLNVSVRQHYYCKWRASLKLPDLPCVTVMVGKGHEEYYPMEVLTIYTPWNYREKEEDVESNHSDISRDCPWCTGERDEVEVFDCACEECKPPAEERNQSDQPQAEFYAGYKIVDCDCEVCKPEVECKCDCDICKFTWAQCKNALNNQ